jgi:hypothetical protein
MQSLGEHPLAPRTLDRLAGMVGTPAVPGVLNEWVISLVGGDGEADRGKVLGQLGT